MISIAELPFTAYTASEIKKNIQVSKWKEIREILVPDPNRSLRSYLRRVYISAKFKLLSLKDRLQGKIAYISVIRGLTRYNEYVKRARHIPDLKDGLIGCMDNYVRKNKVVNEQTNYLDACGGMGCTATEFAEIFRDRGGKSYVADIHEWSINDLPARDIKRARKEGRKWGVKDSLSRKFTFLRSDVTTVSLPEKMDIITAFAGLAFVDDPLKAIINLYNQLKPDGIFMTHYHCPTKIHKEVFEGFYEVLYGLSELGAEVDCQTVQYTDEPEYIALEIVIRKNNADDARLNLTPDKKVTQELVPGIKDLSTKVVYYRSESGMPAIEADFSLDIRSLPDKIESVLSAENPDKGKYPEYRRILKAGLSILENPKYAPYIDINKPDVKEFMQNIIEMASVLDDQSFILTKEKFDLLKTVIARIPTVENPNEDIFVDVFEGFTSEQLKAMEFWLQFTNGCSNQCWFCIISKQMGKLQHMPYPLAVKIIKKIGVSANLLFTYFNHCCPN